MKKLLKRPSPATVIAFIALCVALGGGAYAATSKKVEYKGLSKDARLKVLGVGKTNAQTGTTPCPKLSMTNGTIDGGGSTANGICHLEVDGTEINGTKTNVHTAGAIQSFGISIVTTQQGGKHTFSLACNETTADLKVPQFELSAVQVR